MTAARLRLSLLLALGLGACKGQGPAAPPSLAARAAPACAPAVLVARRGTPALDGSLDQPVWHAAAATEPFLHEAVDRVVPHTEARAAWDDRALYLVLYAADADLRSSDQVAVAFEGGAVEASPGGALRCRFGAQGDCAAAGVVAKLDRDGDVDADREEDEEWVVELEVPWTLLAPAGRPARLPVNFSRLETLSGVRLREVWSRTCGALQLE